MADEIDVRCEPAAGGWSCVVTVTGPRSTTAHEVTVQAADLVRLDPGATDPCDLVRRSFVFLLGRESKESILRRFEITVIGRYFPDWGREVRGRR
jgi:hypothetical protein